MSISVNWSEGFAPAEAERGKFVPIDTASLSAFGYPVSGRGRYALLTYDIAAAAPNSTVVYGGANTLFNQTPSTFSFNPSIDMLEIYNNSGNTAYFLVTSGSTYANLTAMGMPVASNTRYTLSMTISQITIASNASASDFRIYGYYKG
jgi:hypothetical protein